MATTAKIIKDSICNNKRVTTFEITFPRIVLAELNTHRVLSKNSSSSRAIPFNKMVKALQETPFIPSQWQKQHKGMQGKEYFPQEEHPKLIGQWLLARDKAIESASILNNMGVTKQLCNRLLEPFMYQKVLVTATEYENFFKLRCPLYFSKRLKRTFYSKKEFISQENIIFKEKKSFKDYNQDFWNSINRGKAEIHIQELAEKMYDEYQKSQPNIIEMGTWHIPYEEKIDELYPGCSTEQKLIISTVMCARTSYTVINSEGKEHSKEDQLRLFTELLEEQHFSPFEHCVKSMNVNEYDGLTLKKIAKINDVPEHPYSDFITELAVSRNFRGYIPLRVYLEAGYDLLWE